MNLGILTTVHGRWELSYKCIRWHQEFGHVIVGIDIKDWPPEKYYWSTRGEDKYCTITCWDWDGYSGLTDKWIRASKEALYTGDLDGVLIVGSDDFCNAAYIYRGISMLENGHDFVSPSGIYFYDQPTGRACFLNTDGCGAGRFLSKRALEATDYAPWQPGRNDNVDHGQTIVLEAAGIQQSFLACTIDDDHALLDIKTGDNIWAFDDVYYAGRRKRKNGHVIDVSVEHLQERFQGLDVWQSSLDEAKS